MGFNREALNDICKAIEAKQGKGSVYTIDGKNSVAPVARWSSGIEDLDQILYGGIPKGRIIMIHGPESSGKTSLALHLCSLHEAAVYIPVEGTFDTQRAKLFGNKKGQLIVYRDCQFAEDIMNKVFKFAKTGVPLIVLDSVAGLTTKTEYEKILEDSETPAKIGALALFFSKTLKVLNDICETSGTTMIFINQERDKIGAMMFAEQISLPGGKALKFYSSIILQIARRQWIEIANKDPYNSAATEKIGMIAKIKVKKSKVSPPLREAELPLIFNKGFGGGR